MMTNLQIIASATLQSIVTAAPSVMAVAVAVAIYLLVDSRKGAKR